MYLQLCSGKSVPFGATVGLWLHTGCGCPLFDKPALCTGSNPYAVRFSCCCDNSSPPGYHLFSGLNRPHEQMNAEIASHTKSCVIPVINKSGVYVSLLQRRKKSTNDRALLKVDWSGLEPPTSRLSGGCSNRLSYQSEQTRL